MKRKLLLSAVALFVGMASYGQITLQNSVFIDFGPNDGTNGDATGTSGGNIWNDITDAGISATSINLKNIGGSNTGILFDVTAASQTNGKLNGGLLTPDAGNLGEFAVATATEDFFFTATTASVKFSGLKTTSTYIFKLFGSRDNNEVRKTEFLLTGATANSYIQQTSGAGAGANGSTGNNNTITTSAAIVPDANGVITLDIIRNTGTYAFINALKIEEYGVTQLPLKLTSFLGKPLSNYNGLRWTTENEINVNHFELERSVDGDNFAQIATINAGANTYSYNDFDASAENSYYRLKSVDNDGSFEYSKAIVIKNAIAKTNISVYPNPFTESVTIQAAGGPKKITISSIDGKFSRSLNSTESVTVVNLSGEAPGAYVISIKSIEGTVSKTVIKK
jgi:hypothetical protein